MSTSKLRIRLVPAICTALLSVGAAAAPPYNPDLITDGNMWTITAYYDNSPVHLEAATQRLCFFPDGFSGTHQRYTWVSISFPDWNGRATQEGDQIFMHGDFAFPQPGVEGGHDSMQWEIVTSSPKNEGAGHWHEWLEDGRLGRTIGFGNTKLVRVGRCPWQTIEQALEAVKDLPPPTDSTGKPLLSPAGFTQ
jgi:hypothetical protein